MKVLTMNKRREKTPKIETEIQMNSIKPLHLFLFIFLLLNFSILKIVNYSLIFPFRRACTHSQNEPYAFDLNDFPNVSAFGLPQNIFSNFRPPPPPPKADVSVNGKAKKRKK